MLSIDNILETNQMIHDNKLDVRTITMGISLLECASSSGKDCLLYTSCPVGLYRLIHF